MLVRSTEQTPMWIGREGENFLVLPYSRQDGLNVVWLKSMMSGGIETTDIEDILSFFVVVKEGFGEKLFG